MDRLTEIRNSWPEGIKDLISKLDPELLAKLPTTYLDSLDDKDRVICFRVTLLCYYATACMKLQIPHEMQLRAILADQHGKGYLVAAGTGSGKTLPIAVNILLEDPVKCLTTLTISPLKCLQTTHEDEFNNVYGIPTVVINEDTPWDEAWWNVSHPISFLQLSLPHVRNTDRGTSMT